MRAHVLDEDGQTIIDTVEVDNLTIIAGLVDAAVGGNIGDRVVAGKVVACPAPTISVPESVTMRQARLGLLGAGILAQVNAVIAVLPGVAGDAARIEWEFATAIRRDSAMVAQVSGSLGLSGSQLDSLFIAAASL